MRGRSRVAKQFVLLVVLALFVTVLVTPGVALATAVPWFRVKAPLPTPMWGFAAARGKSATILTFGGVDQNNQLTAAINLFNPMTDGQTRTLGTWTENVGSLDMPRSQMAVASGPNGIVYLLGGTANGPGTMSAQDTILAVDTNAASPSAVVIGHLEAPKSRAQAEIIGNTIYVVGGLNVSGQAINNIEAFQLGADGLSGTDLGTVATLPTGRWAAGTFVRNGMLYMAGGRVGLISNSVPTKETWILDPSDYSMTRGDDLPYARAASTFAPMAGGAWYDCTGTQGDVLAFDPSRAAGDQYLTVGSYPNPRNRVTNVSAFGFLYVMGGASATTGKPVSDVATAILMNTIASGTGSVSGAGSSTVSVGGQSASVSFPSGTSTGQLTISTLGSTPSDVPAPFDTSVGNVVLYDVATSANTAGGSATVTLPYSGTTQPVVRHWVGTDWVDVASTWDPAARTVSFQTTSFSPFGVGESAGSPSGAVSTPASSTWSLGVLLVLALVLAGWSLGNAALARNGE